MKKMIVCLLLLAMPRICAAENHELTPSHAFGVMDLANKHLDMLITAKAIKDTKPIRKPEKGLAPMHVYQMAVACVDAMISFEKKEGMRCMPKVVASPTYYVPEDVKNLGDMLVYEIRRILPLYGISEFPEQTEKFQGKVPTDVFGRALDMFVKIRVLTGTEDIAPNEVYSQMIRAISDVKSVLTNIDPAQRFRIDAPQDIPTDMKPSRVFEICLNIRRDINGLREHFNLPAIPVPDMPKDMEISSADVFVQTQIIIAELNLLKMGTGTVSSTPLAIPVSGKTPADTYRQAVMVRYLLSQVKPLQEMVGKDEK